MDEWFKARNAWAGAFETLSDAEAGRLAKALWKYTTTGKEAELSGNEKGCFAMILWTLHMDEAERNNTSAIRRLAGLASAEKRKATKATSVDFVDTDEQTPTKATDKNKRKNKNKNEIYTTTTNRAREEETPFGTVTVDPLIIKIQSELNGLTDTHYQRLEDFRQYLGDELVSFAIDAAVGNGVRNWNYVEAILKGYEKDGIKTIGEAKARAEKRKEERPQRSGAGAGKVLNAQKFSQRDYTEDELKSGSDDQLFAEIMKARQGTA